MSAIGSDVHAFGWPLQANSWSASLASCGCGLEATKATEGIKLLFFCCFTAIGMSVGAFFGFSMCYVIDSWLYAFLLG